MKNLVPGLCLMLCILNVMGASVVPVITSFSPVTGTIGTTVTITGTGFSSTASDNTVYFGAVKATVSAATATSITISAPAGAGSVVPVSVVVGGSIAYSVVSTTPTFTYINTPNVSPNYSYSYTSLSNGPRALVSSDFNADGYPDIAVANLYSDDISVLLGNNLGSYGTAVNFPVGAGPISIVAADYNDDGKIDLAVANFNTSDVSILLGDGTGSFGASVNFAVGLYPDGMIGGDFNLDGNSDLATCNWNNTVSILLGNGIGGFGAAVNYPTGSEPHEITTGDFNADGIADLATANTVSDNASILFGTGTGTFAAATTLSIGDAPTGMVASDFNNDGKTDLAVIYQSPSTSGGVYIFLNSASGTMVAGTSITSLLGASKITSGDVNGDGNVDLISTNINNAAYSIFMGSGTGTFAAPVYVVPTYWSVSLITGDFNSDGKADIAGTALNSNKLSVLLNVTSSISTPVPSSLSGFVACAGSASDYKSFSVSGAALVGDITLNAPTGYEISQSTGIGYNTTLTLSQSSGVVAPTTIYVRIKSTASGNPSGNISIESAGATTQNVALTGLVDEIPVPVISGPANACVPSTGNTYSTAAGMTGYSWTVSAGGTITSGAGSDEIAVTWNTAGAQSVSVTYTNSNSCSAAAATIYNVNVSTLPVPVITGPAEVCLASTDNVYITDAGMTGYVWTVSAGGSITAGIGTNEITVTWSSSGSKTVSVNYVNSGSCNAATATVYDVTVNALPTVNSVSDQELCNGASTAVVSFSGSVPGTVFNWVNNTPAVGLAASGTGNIPSFVATNSGGSSLVATITVTPSIPVPSSAIATQVINGSLTTSDLALTNGRVIRAGYVSSCASPQSFPGSWETGPYYYKTYSVTNTTSQLQCVQISYVVTGSGDVQVVAYNGSFDPTDISANYIADGGNSSAAGDVESFSFNLASNATAILVATDVNPNETSSAFTITVDGLAPGSSCNGAPVAFDITVIPYPVPAIAGPASVSIGSAGNVYTTAAGMVNYQWTVPAGGTITAGGTTSSNTVTITWPTQGIYDLNVDYTNAYGCIASAPAAYSVNVHATKIYVNASASGSNNGLTWADAYTSFQSALNAAISGDTIWVAAGTYKPSSSYTLTNIPSYYHFRMKNGVAIFGGFAGTETDLAERTDFNVGGAHETIFSGDLNGDDNYSVTPWTGNTENCFHVFYHPASLALNSSAILDGFTIKGGNNNAWGEAGPGGGAMSNYSSSPTLNNLSVINNFSLDGGGIFNSSSSPSITNSLIANNKCSVNGGGIHNIYNSSPQFTNLSIVNNSSAKGGGGVHCYSNSFPVLNNCIIWGNTATQFGNQLYNEGSSSLLTLNYSCYSNGTGDVNGTITATNNNIVTDPGFVNAASGDFRIYNISGCADAGLNAYNTELTDIRGTGFDRKLNKLTGAAGTIDMGAYEYKHTVDPVYTCVDPTSGGTIAADQSGCPSFDPAALTSSALPTGYSGTLEYKWQSSTIGSTSGFADINSSNLVSYDPGALTQTTWYKRLARVNCKTGWTTAAESNVIELTVKPTPTVTATPSSEAICNGNATNIELTSVPSGADFAWTVSTFSGTVSGATAGSGSLIAQTLSGNGVSNYVITPTLNSCAGAPVTVAVTVNPFPVPVITGPVTVCAASTGNLYTTTAGMTGYTWTLSAGGNITAGSGTNEITVTWNAAGAQNVSVNYTNSNTCTASTATVYDVTVNELPTVNAVADQAFCNGATTTAVSLSGSVTGTVFNWVNNTPAIGLAASGTGDIPSFVTANTGTTPSIATVTVTPVSSAAVSSQVFSGSLTATDATLNDGRIRRFLQPSFCASPKLFPGAWDLGPFYYKTYTLQNTTGQEQCVTVTYSVSGTGDLQVTAYDGSFNPADISINYIADCGNSSISGSIQTFSFTLANNATVVLVANDVNVNETCSAFTITVEGLSQGIECTGTPTSFTFTVNPTPTVNAVADQTVCNNVTTNAIAFGGNITGTVYNWTNNNTSIGLAASGSGDISAFTAINTGTSPVTATITVTPSYTNAGITCTGTPTSFAVTVNPTPIPEITGLSSVCLASTGNVYATTAGMTGYTWSHSAGGTVTAGSGTNEISVTWNTAGAQTVSVNYINGSNCSSATSIYNVTVNELPTVNAVADQAFCDGATTTAVSLSGSVTGTVFNWVNNTPSIGLAASGTGDIPSFVTANAGTTPVVATVTVTPSTSSASVPELLYYKFNETGSSIANLASIPPAGTNTATLMGALSQGGNGICNGTLVGTGGSTAVDYVNTNWATDLNGTSWTISFKTANIQPSSTLFYIFGDQGASNFRCFTNGVAGAENWILRGPVADVKITGGATVAPHTNTFVYDKIAGNIKAYLDGVLVQTVAQSAPVISGSLFTVGACTGGSTGLNSGGFIDEFRLYNRALSLSEVQELSGCSAGSNCAGTPITYNITVNPTPTVNVVGNQTVCNNAATNAVTFSGNVTGTVYNWTNDNTSIGLAASGSGDISAFTAINTGTSPVTATITVTPSYTNAGITCTGTPTSFTIIVNSLPVPVIIGTASVCTTSTGNVYSTESGMTGYNWTISAGGTITAGAGTNQITVTWNTAGPQTVTVNYTNANSCTAASATIYNVTVNALPVPIISGPASVCVTSTGNVYSTESGMTGYNWTISAGGIITAGAGTNQITVIWNTAGPQTVNVNYTNANSCTAATATIYNVTVNALPVPVISGPASVCVTSTGNVYSTESGMTGYNWTITAGGTITAGAGTNQITVTWHTTGPQAVNVNYTNANSCTAATATIYNVTVNALPVPVISGPASVCVVSTGNVYSTESGMTGYNWTISAGGTITAGVGTNQITVAWNTAGPQTVSVNYTNASTCTAISATVYSVNVNDLPVPIISGPASACVASTSNIYSTESGMTGYTWSITAGGTITAGEGTHEITVTWSIPGLQTVNVNYTNSNNCMAATATAYSVMVTDPIIPTISGPSETCQGITSNIYTTEAGMTQYIWTVQAGGAITSGAASNSITVTWNTSGPKTVSVNYENGNGCSALTPAVFNVLVNPETAPTITGDDVVCAGANDVVYTTEAGFSNYTWTVSYGGAITAGQNTNEVTVNWSTAGSRSISVNYANTSGCSAIVASIFPVTVQSVPVPIISGDNSLCQGTTAVTYTTQINYDNYVWTVSPGGNITSGAGTNAITVNWTGSGNQSVSVGYTNNLGCEPLEPTVFDVFVTPLPATPVITQHGDTLSSSALTGNQWYLNGNIIQGANGQEYVAVYSGNYTVVVTVDGCSSGVSNSILVLPVSITGTEVSQSFEVYPNPNHGSFNIKVTSANPVEYDVEIYNNSGSLVWRKENVSIDGTFILPINLDNVSNGVYLVTLRNATTNLVKRLVILK